MDRNSNWLSGAGMSWPTQLVERKSATVAAATATCAQAVMDKLDTMLNEFASSLIPAGEVLLGDIYATRSYTFF